MRAVGRLCLELEDGGWSIMWQDTRKQLLLIHTMNTISHILHNNYYVNGVYFAICYVLYIVNYMIDVVVWCGYIRVCIKMGVEVEFMYVYVTI